MDFRVKSRTGPIRSPAKSPVTVGRERDRRDGREEREGERKKKRKKKAHVSHAPKKK